MSSHDPSFDYFRLARRRNLRITDNERRFDAFRNYVLNNSVGESGLGEFVIQFVCHPNFDQDSKSVTYYMYDSDTGRFDNYDSLPDGYKRGNSYLNYLTRSGEGHAKGLYFELNLYTLSGHSSHHTSRVKGTLYPRNDDHDVKHGTTKGPHWLE